jgi:hypothetical protein
VLIGIGEDADARDEPVEAVVFARREPASESMLEFSGLGSLPRNSKQRRMRGPSLYMTPVEISILISIRPTAGRTDL